MPQVTPLSVVLALQAILMAISQLDFVGLLAQRIIVVALIVINAVLVFIFQSGRPTLQGFKAQILGRK